LGLYQPRPGAAVKRRQENTRIVLIHSQAAS